MWRMEPLINYLERLGIKYSFTKVTYRYYTFEVEDFPELKLSADSFEGLIDYLIHNIFWLDKKLEELRQKKIQELKGE